MFWTLYVSDLNFYKLVFKYFKFDTVSLLKKYSDIWHEFTESMYFPLYSYLKVLHLVMKLGIAQIKVIFFWIRVQNVSLVVSVENGLIHHCVLESRVDIVCLFLWRVHWIFTIEFDDEISVSALLCIHYFQSI